MNSKDKLLEATLNALQENVYDEPLYGKDVLYVFEDFDTGVDKFYLNQDNSDQKKLQECCSTTLHVPDVSTSNQWTV